MTRRRDQNDDLDLNVSADTASADREAAREEARRNPDPNIGTGAGQAVGAGGGALAGAAAGTVIAGPIGTAIGAIAGALGGWWAGREVAEASARWTDDQDRAYREHFTSRTDRPVDRAYDDVRPAYQLGHLAAHNPAYKGRSFSEIEPELQRGWTDDLAERGGDWVVVRVCASEAFNRAQHAPRGEQLQSTERQRDIGTSREPRDERSRATPRPEPRDLGVTDEGEEARRRF